jgi:hypothetical protein
MKIRLVGIEFHTDGRTDGQAGGQPGIKLIVAIQSFANAPENSNFTHFVKPNICVGIVGVSLLVVLVAVAFTG